MEGHDEDGNIKIILYVVESKNGSGNNSNTILEIDVNLHDSIKSVHEHILFRTKIPVTRHRLFYNGRELCWSNTLHECYISSGYQLELELELELIDNLRMRGLELNRLHYWELVDKLAMSVCEEEGPEDHLLIRYLDDVLDQLDSHKLEMLIETCVPATLSMLCESETPWYKEISLKVFQSFLDDIVSLPPEVDAQRISVLLETCRCLAKFTDMKDLCISYVEAVMPSRVESRRSQLFDDIFQVPIPIQEIHQCLCEVAESVCSLLLLDDDQIPTFLRSLKQGVEDLNHYSRLYAANKLMRNRKLGERRSYVREDARLDCACRELLDTMEKCLEELTSRLYWDKSFALTQETPEGKSNKYSTYPIVLDALYFICITTCVDDDDSSIDDDAFWDLLNTNKHAISWLVAKYDNLLQLYYQRSYKLMPLL